MSEGTSVMAWTEDEDTDARGRKRRDETRTQLSGLPSWTRWAPGGSVASCCESTAWRPPGPQGAEAGRDPRLNLPPALYGGRSGGGCRGLAGAGTRRQRRDSAPAPGLEPRLLEPAGCHDDTGTETRPESSQDLERVCF